MLHKLSKSHYTVFNYSIVGFYMKVIPIYAEAGISGFESPAAEYKELGLSLDQLIIKNPNATFIVKHLLNILLWTTMSNLYKTTV